MCLKSVRAEEARVNSKCFTCFRPKRIAGWSCSACKRRAQAAMRKLARRAKRAA